MISVERSFYEKFPRLAEGRVRDFAQPVVALLRRIACEERINAILADVAPLSGFAFVERVLDLLKVSYSVANTDRENVPVEGRVVIVANHPLGALDALALIHLVGSVRRDVKVLANDVLMQFEPLAPLLLPLPVFGGGSALGGARRAYRALEREEAVIVFPSGEVSRMRPHGVRDLGWSAGFARLALRTGAPVLPVHIAAQNSPMFYGVSMLAKPLASLLLAREMFGAARTRIGFQVGEIVPPAALRRPALSPEKIARHMRRHVYRLARRRPTVFPTSTAVAHPESPLDVRRALRAAEPLGKTCDGKQILLLEAQADCPALREIGRLRELAFRRVGEGTGARRDLDRYDAYYRHLVLWDEQALAIVGAYRLGEAGPILRERGLAGLYSASLFDYAPQAHAFLPEAVELGRSFVQPAYWGSRSLDYLWQGIGAYLRARPSLRYLFGPVSLSASLPLEAREWIVHYHRHYFGDADRLARARNPFVISAEVAAAAEAAWSGRRMDEAFALLRQRLAALGGQLPTLYRQYADLCEPAGVRFLDFGVDPAFGGCIDGLVRLDLHQLRPAKRARYVDGRRAA
jgi:putative hemolysin